MKLQEIFGIAGLCISTACSSAAATHVYDLVPFTFVVSDSIDAVFDGAYDVTGYIETDGVLGVLAPANLLSSALIALRQDDGFDIAIRVTLQTTSVAAVTKGMVTLVGATLAATDTDLMLQLDRGGMFVFSDGTNSFGFTDGSIIAFVDMPAQGIAAQTTVSQTDHAGIANMPFAATPVPLPAAAWLLAGGLGILRVTARGHDG